MITPSDILLPIFANLTRVIRRNPVRKRTLQQPAVLGHGLRPTFCTIGSKIIDHRPRYSVVTTPFFPPFAAHSPFEYQSLTSTQLATNLTRSSPSVIEIP